MLEDVAVFLKKLKEYNLLDLFFEYNSFDLFNNLDSEELKKMNLLEKEEFENILFTNIYHENWINEKDFYLLIEKMKRENNPNIELVINVYDSFQKKLENYCLKHSNNNSKKLKALDFLDIFSQVEKAQQGINAYHSIENLIDSDYDNLYDAVKTVALCNSEVCSNFIFQKIKDTKNSKDEFIFLKYYLRYLPNVSFDEKLIKFYYFFNANNNNKLLKMYDKTNHDDLIEMLDCIMELDFSDLYKTRSLERVLDCVNSLNLSYKDLTKILKTDSEKKDRIIWNLYLMVSDQMILNSKQEACDICDYRKLTDIIINIDNEKLIDILDRQNAVMFDIIVSEKIDVLEFFTNISNINDDKELKKLDNYFNKIIYARSNGSVSKKAKRLVNHLSNNNSKQNI